MSDNRFPLVSVIMPVYNGEDFIDAAITSILEQTYQNLELILIDDCGMDKSMEKVSYYAQKDERVRIIHNPHNMGIAYARNIGMRQSHGKYIAIMDDDDWAYPARIQKQADFLESHPEYGVVGAMTQWIDENANVIKWEKAMPADPLKVKAFFLFYNIFNNSEVMFRKEIMERYKISYEDHMLGMEDFKFWIRMSKVTNITNLNEVLVQHRITENSETSRIIREQGGVRRQKFAQLQRYSLEQSGFTLKEEEYEFLSDMLREEGIKKDAKGHEMIRLFYIFYDLVCQARQANMDITMVIAEWFRNLYVEKINAMQILDLWGDGDVWNG